MCIPNVLMTLLFIYCLAGNSQATMNINIKPQPGEFPSSEEIDKPLNQQDPGTIYILSLLVIISPLPFFIYLLFFLNV